MAKLHESTGNLADSTTAQQSSVSSLNKRPSSNKLLTLVGKLADVDKRAKTAKQLAKFLGAEELLIFTRDTELAILLPAAGFVQTLPNGKKWNVFLEACIKQGEYLSKLPYLNTTDIRSASGLAYKDQCVFILLGGNPKDQDRDQIVSLLPLLNSVLQYEQEAVKNNALLKLSKKSSAETQYISRKLDLARRELQSALLEKEKEIHARMASEHALQLERQQIYDLFMQAPAVIAILEGPKHVFKLANTRYMQLVGQHRDMLGKPIRKALPELEGQGIYELLDEVYTSGNEFFGKELLVKLDRTGNGVLEDGFFNFVYQPFRDGNGNIEGILVHAVEVTDQVKAQLRIEESERNLRTLADNIPNLAWMANDDGYIYWYNSRWYEYTGTTPKKMEGWGWQSTHDPEVLPIVLKTWRLSIKTGKPFEMVFPLKGADGVFRPFLTRVVPIYDESGKIIQWFGTNTDITAQKELERQKDNFLGIASHELKTPVTSIKAYGQVLQKMFRRKGDIKAAEHLAKMDAQVDKLTSLISDLLDVTKIQAGRMEFHEEYFDFNELVSELVEQLQLTTEKHTLIKELDTTHSIYGDQDRIGQVITNFISNAIKYSPHSKKIIIKTSLDTDSITLCVKDFGVGIPKDKQDKVFEQFYRVSGDKQTTFPGFGLGLYVSSEIIKREGGKIWVESEGGKGSIFYFMLPIKKSLKKQQKNTLMQEEIQHG